MSDVDENEEATSVALVTVTSREGRDRDGSHGSSDQLERLRAAWVIDIDLLEKMGLEVINLRRRFREALQQLDILIQRNAALEARNTSLESTNADLEATKSILEAVLAAKESRITALESELASIIAQRRAT